MRKGLIVAVVACVVMGGTALAHGPSGSYEGSKDHDVRNNNVHCAKGQSATQAGTKVYWGYNGVEVCKDRNGVVPAGPQGRVYVAMTNGGYVAADGDRNNPEQARGYARIDRTGPHCSDGKDQDAAHSKTKGDPMSCDAD